MARRAVVYWDSAVFLALLNQDKSPEQLQKGNDVWVAGCFAGQAMAAPVLAW